MLYDDKFISSLPEAEEAWKSPIVVYVAKEKNEHCKQLKVFIERWFEKIEEEKKNSYSSRLKSLDDKVFLAQVSEFFVYDFCDELGKIHRDPKLENGKTPELLWDIKNQEGLLDVVTLFDNREREKSNNAIDHLLNYLGELEHYYNFSVWYEDIDWKTLQPKKIKKRLIRHLDCLDFHNIEDDEELMINDFGFVGSFTPIRKANYQKEKVRFFSLLGPGEEIKPNTSIESRIKSKLKKYKWDGPLFVAICKSASFGVDWEDVAEVLYGPSLIRYNSKTENYETVLGEGGILMPKERSEPKNTSLTGVLFCELEWRGGGIPVFKVGYFINPFAKYPITLPVCTYPTIEKDKVVFDWKQNER
ncbi:MULTISPECIES: hypothetical protein [unclassified Exiguobacterium]|uniref:hypothetical protein n=1 Tax=unclassified Exiguobacterium TaxID=2644629 RepID=UPI001BECBAEE|nr:MULTISPECIES: hypothetical protein [unclassified Exiguobacterium]